MWEADAGSLRISFVSLAAEQVLGFPLSAWRAEASFFLDRVHPDDRDRVLGVLRSAAADRADERIEHRMLTADGRTVWVHTGVTVGKRPEGGAVLHGITMDITDLHLAAEEVQNRARQQAATAALGQIALAGASLRALFQQGTEAVARELRVELAAVMELSHDDRTLRLAAAHGFPEDAVGRDVVVAESGTLWAKDCAPPADVGPAATFALLSRRPVVSEDFATDRRFELLPLVREVGAASGATVAIAGDSRCYGALAAYARSRRAFTTDDVHFLESVANILAAAVERDRLLADLHDARERAERSARGREELVTILSHDLRNALGAVLLAAQLASRSAELPDKEAAVKRQLGRITRQVGSINRLLSSILDVGRIERGRLSMERAPRAPAAVAQEAIELVAPQAEDRGLSLTVQVAQDLPPILADRERMVQVLANLLGNAVKFTRQGGVTLSARAEGDEVLFSVADTGPGIPDDQLPRLFDRYWQAPSGARQGVGLGLFVAKSIVEAHGGRIWVESAGEDGSTFRFTVPIAEERTGDPPTKT
ncbi:MAG: ATP-binding protein [Minicystis sp.]